jgi:hypothetical protein
MDWLFPVLWWSGPVGIGAFLAGLGVLFWGISQVEQVRRARAGAPTVPGEPLGAGAPAGQVPTPAARHT